MSQCKIQDKYSLLQSTLDHMGALGIFRALFLNEPYSYNLKKSIRVSENLKNLLCTIQISRQLITC